MTDLDELTQEQAIRLAARAALARRSLLDFCQLMNPRYETPAHIRLLGSRLEAMERGEILRLMVFLPPRHGKSELGSGMFPAWFIGRNPSRRVILTSYAATLAETFSVQNRDLIQYNPMWPLVFPSVTISPTVRAVDKWAVYGQRESLIAAGVGGPITGFGAHLLIIDDPVKNYEEAASKSNREKQFQWYKTTARTRLQKDGAVFLIMTRWVEDDLAGMILNSEEGKDFEVIHLPAESLGTEADYTGPEGVPEEVRRSTAFPDALGRPRGEPLWPEFGFDRKFLASARNTLQHDYHALYQGSPTPPAGEKFRRGDLQVDPDLTGWTLEAQQRSWDLAWSESDSADWTVGLLMQLWTKAGAEPGEGTDWLLLLADVVRWKSEDVAEGILQQAIADGPEVEQVIETVALQNRAFQSIRRDERMWNIRMKGYKPPTDKLMRAQSTIRLTRRGRVWLASGRWNEDFLAELACFPSGKHDDQVDALTQGVDVWAPRIDALLQRKKAAAVPKRKVGLPWEFRLVEPVQVDLLGWRSDQWIQM